MMVRGDDRVARDIENLMIELKNIGLIKSRTKAIAGAYVRPYPRKFQKNSERKIR